MKKLRVAINGFGRIGRQIFRIASEKKYFDVVAVNDLANAHSMAHLLKYDSNYGTFKANIKTEKEDTLKVNGKAVAIFTERDPEKLPWKKLKIDVVLEATGFFTDKEGAMKHIKAGAKKVIITAPGKDADITVVMGVNEEQYDPKKHKIISNASCTTNCLAPVVKIINDALGIEKGLMTTVHSYTNDQRILDVNHEDLRRARAAALSMIPTTTGAAKAVTLTIPELEGKLNGLAIRVPTPTVSIVDFTCIVRKKTSTAELNKIFEKASKGTMKKYLQYSTEPLVSMDFKGSEYSSIFDAPSTLVVGEDMIKVMAWYDNEWGYSCRVVDLVNYIGKN